MVVFTPARRKFMRNVGLLLSGYTGLSAFTYKFENKKVTLLGDSIRKGYQPYVSLFLPDDVAVWGPEENTRHSVHLLANSPRWIKDQPVDIIHLNSGLHDIKNIPFHSRKPLVSAELYAENIERIIKYIHHCWPECVIIWSTTTPVSDEKALAAHEKAQDFSRYNEDVIKYNTISTEVVQRLGVPVNDLYAFVMQADMQLIMKDDGVHFTDFGNELLGEQVADSIRLFLK
jgi:lysophospholipase L1-like esterase